jgi:sarcosine oxidase subunit beta
MRRGLQRARETRSNGSMSSARDVVIIGAGVIGASIAHALTRRGFATLNLDAGPAPGYGSTSHSSAIVRPFYSHATSCAIAHEGRHRWLDWQRHLGVPVGASARYRESGGLVLVREGEEGVYATNLAVLDEVGVDWRWLDPTALNALYPGISLDTFGPPRRLDDAGFGRPTGGRIAAGIYIPAAGYVDDPQLAARNLADAASAAGARFRFGARVTAIVRDADRIAAVAVGGERIDCAILINAAGPHSAIVNSLAGVRLPISTRAERHEVAYLRAPPGYVDGGNGFVVDLDSGVYQRPDGVDLLIGSADPACDPRVVVDPDDYETSFTDQWQLQVLRAAQRFPTLGIENRARGTVGLYDVSDDWIPIYDRTGVEGYFVAIGTSGNQFKNAPVVGDLMATIVEHTLAGHHHDVAPACYHLEHVARTVDLSFYSRNRVPQATNSVLA